MSEPTCPFCGRDPFHYVDNGIGMEAVAVDCCELGNLYFRGARAAPEEIDLSWEEFSEIGQRLLSTSTALRAMREALEKISAEQWKDRSTVSELNAWPAFQRLNSHVVELYAIADAALTSKEGK